jgi:signal transduction histidine kinase
MVAQIREQTIREEKSKEVLDALNRMSDQVMRSARQGMFYSYTKNPELLQAWESGKKEALALLDKATSNASDPQQLKDIHDTRLALDKISQVLSAESAKSNYAKADKFAELAGVTPAELLVARKNAHFMRDGEHGPGDERADQAFAERGEAMGGPHGGIANLMRRFASEGAGEEGGEHHGGMANLMRRFASGEEGKEGAEHQGGMAALMRRFASGEEGDEGAEHHGGIANLMRRFASEEAGEGGEEPRGGMASMMRRFSSGEGQGGGGGMLAMMGMLASMGGRDGESGGMGGLGALGMFGQMQSLLKDSVMVQLIRPLIEGEESQERLMDREKVVGQKLSKERETMINNLRLTLLGGFGLSIALSSLLALYLMRSLTGRLQHVMENTARLVKREQLDAPKSGGDEIAYLDSVLFETGNHLLGLEAFKQELISIVSHELRTPLLSISSALELFSAGAMGELSEKGLARLKLAQGESARLIRLINDLLDIEKMEAGKFVLDTKQFNISEVVETSIESVRALAEAKAVKLETECFDDAATLVADKDRLCQVLINLLSNAIKYSPENETVKLAVESLPAGRIKFMVMDRGRGIPDELKDKIFDRFVQVEENDARVHGGSGLGLAISKAIIEQHGGNIGVESQMGIGSSFWFVLNA